MNYKESKIPYHLHEFIDKTITRLKKAFTDPGESYPEPHTVNLLWFNPIIGAELHFTPWRIGEVTSDIGGPESAYFTTLLNLAPLPVPAPADLDLLVEHIARSPQAASALNERSSDLCKAIGRNHTGIRSLIRNILNTFCDCLRNNCTSQEIALAQIGLLFDKNLLVPVIHILLGAIPQYPFAKGQLLLKGRDSRWIEPIDKTEKWKEMVGKTDPATAMFALLSIVESLQWHNGHKFYVIPNLFEFLNSTGDHVAKMSLQQYALSLSRLSLYLTTPEISKDQKEALVHSVRANLMNWIAQLCGLVRAVNSAFMWRSLQTCDDLFNWLSQKYARGLLGVAGPQEIVYLQEFLTSEGALEVRKGKVKKQSEHTLNQLPTLGKATSIATSLVYPWGIYEIQPGEIDIDLTFVPTSSTPCFYHDDHHFYVASRNKQLTTCVVCSMDRSNTEFKDAVQNSRFCVADLLQDILSTSSDSIMSGSDEWYKKAFGVYYYYFDILRQKEMKTTDFLNRRNREATFYVSLLQSLQADENNALNVLDIGIGYGRLEKAIYQEATKDTGVEKLLSKTTFWGIDLSLEMKRRHSDYLGEINELGERYKIGEMFEAYELFTDVKFDLVILSFSTFGYYASDKGNRLVLEQIAKVLRPCGMVVIEQFNPHLTEAELPYWPQPCVIEGRLVELAKSTVFIPLNDCCTLYMGEYFYKEKTPEGPRPIRRDEYCVRLYNESWFRDSLLNAGFDKDTIRFYADFSENDFDGNVAQNIMICLAKTNPDITEGVSTIMIDYPKGKVKLEVALNLLNRVNNYKIKEHARSMYPFLFGGKIIDILVWIAKHKHKLDHNNVENVKLALKWTDDLFEPINTANKANPDLWNENKLIETALTNLVNLLSEMN